MYENIFLTGLVFTVLMLIAPKVLGGDAPMWIKAVIVIPGVIGVVAMLASIILWIWAN